MEIIKLFLMAICAVGVFLTGLYSKQIVMRYKRYKARLQRKSLAGRVEWLEGRAQIHDNQNKGFHNKMDELEKYIKYRETDRKAKVRKIVLEYLNELKNGESND